MLGNGSFLDGSTSYYTGLKCWGGQPWGQTEYTGFDVCAVSYEEHFRSQCPVTGILGSLVRSATEGSPPLIRHYD